MSEAITYKHIFDFTSNGVIATDDKGYIVLINRQARKILRLKKNDVLNKLVTEVLPLTGELMMKCLSTRKPQLGRHIYGKQVNLVVNITAVREGPHSTGVVVNFQKMRQFENSAHQLVSYKRLNRQLNTIFQYSSDIIWLYDGGGKVIDINRAAERDNKIRANDVIGKTYTEVIAMGLFKKSIVPEVLKTKRQVTLLQTGINGKSVWLNTGTPVFDDAGNIDFIVVNARDMTQLNKMKEKLEDSRMVTNKFKDELAEIRLMELQKQEIVAESKKMRQVLKIAAKLARMEATNILILGESGTGKGLLSKFIHNYSKRKKRPFIQINCAALPENLLEAELFGYEKGAFTGAREEGKAGLFELAHEGTLFLDEIGDLSLSVQAKLLKYLDDHEVMRLGALSSKKVDCTVIAATNRDLALLVGKRKFREDLYYRLSAFTVKIPPLRERPEDIFELLSYFLNKFNKDYKLSRRLSADSMKELQNYAYPGNVRELKNILKKAVVLSDEEVLDSAFFSSIGLKENGYEKFFQSKKHIAYPLSLEDQLQALERNILSDALARFKTTRKVAENLKTSKSTVVRKIKKHGIR
jgi:PAS domain S-box-containing protein